ncbi:MAG: bifunctional diaminohydroxyphosphoribosylaminopyrimidine deaminase/5-amino-6-(5-phosphoribosylamino)uracil reductase RibD [Candidatus Cloacimonetes bacterium]|nr:bifunctional diaminohydroxyphosphoribosylaminopyrimidine deaminase/5-amino-6-(5-phosphoribosylamino)uracil reductase RibD [Candidatus Cloacimonadota bacterium]
MYISDYMIMAIAEAEKMRGKTNPNPNVGAVIVKNNRVIGTGATQPYGKDHAEIQALKNCMQDPLNADLYVTLEPCCHAGKTPPCTDAIIKANIKNVYVGIKDPNPLVNGKGFEALKKAGINVEYHFYENEISQQLETYLWWITTQRPFIILKNAASLDGKIAAENGDSKWITSKAARKKVHQLRNEVDAVMTTVNTVLKDDPLCNVRLDDIDEVKHPIRLILDPKLEIPLTSAILNSIDKYKTIVFYDKSIKTTGNFAKLNKFIASQKDSMIALTPVAAENGKLDLAEVFYILGQWKITSIMVEAGTTLNSYLIQNNFVNKICYFIAPKILGGNQNVFQNLNIPSLEKHIPLRNTSVEIYGDNVLIIGYMEVN